MVNIEFSIDEIEYIRTLVKQSNRYHKANGNVMPECSSILKRIRDVI